MTWEFSQLPGKGKLLPTEINKIDVFIVVKVEDSASFVERLPKQFEAEARKKGEELARREQALTEKTAEIERAKETIEGQVAERSFSRESRVLMR